MLWHLFVSLCIQETQLYTKEWCKNGVVGIKMGSKQIFSFGFGCGKTKDELMKLGDEVIERLTFKHHTTCVAHWVQGAACGEDPYYWYYPDLDTLY